MVMTKNVTVSRLKDALPSNYLLWCEMRARLRVDLEARLRIDMGEVLFAAEKLMQIKFERAE